MKSVPGNATLWCLLGAALFGASTPVSKIMLRSASPLQLAGLFYLGAAFAVAPWAWRRGSLSLQSIDRRNWLALSGTVLFGGVAAPVLLLVALTHSPAGSVALWLTLEVPATALLAYWFFKEHLSASTWLAVAMVVVGSVLLVMGPLETGYAAILVALASVAWAIDNNCGAIIDKFTPTQIACTKGVVAGTVNFGLGVFLQSPPSLETAALGMGVGALAYGASMLLLISSYQQLGATRAQIIFATNPIWGLLVAYLSLGEPIGPRQLLATMVIAFGIWLWHREHHEHAHSHAATSHTHWHRHDDGHHTHAHGESVSLSAWHSHQHTHEPMTHSHPHRPDLHHRHEH